MKYLVLLIILAALLVGAFVLGYKYSKSEHENVIKNYASAQAVNLATIERLRKENETCKDAIEVPEDDEAEAAKQAAEAAEKRADALSKQLEALRHEYSQRPDWADTPVPDSVVARLRGNANEG